jgi:hypothetical protein
MGPNVEVSGVLKRAKRALPRPLDRPVRVERNSKARRNTRGRHATARSGRWLFTHAYLGAQPPGTQGSSPRLSAPRKQRARGVCESPRARPLAGHFARVPSEPEQRATVGARRSASRRPSRTLEIGLSIWALTFDMSGGPTGAKRPLERPLDGRVRPVRRRITLSAPGVLL